ncbi:MAG: winged helix-turn-helix domain-containing protein [Acidobacteria bacterium]|nr:winged helix-turn-helix domain-containing protein [Acidobacteriota bacterium]
MSSRDSKCRRRSRRLRFGDFEFDPSARELVGPAGVVRLQPQPARLLELLLDRSGDVVTRETIRRHLWQDEIHVEYDQSMNTCVKRIRSALDDRAEAPRYIETLPRLGYRFLEPVTEGGGGGGLLGVRGGTRRGRSRSTVLAVLLAVGLAIGAASLAVWRAFVASPCPEFETATRAEAASGPRPTSHVRARHEKPDGPRDRHLDP